MTAKPGRSKPRSCRTTIAVVLFCAATAIASSAQTFTTLLSFDNSTGARPDRALVQGPDGNFYGETSFGPGNYEMGTVFSLSPSGTLTTLHTFFPHGINGDSPSGLVLANSGVFYGTSYYGGADGAGTIFRISSAGQLGLLHTFDTTDGAYPSGPLIQATDGDFYGTTVNGGINSSGTFFKMTPGGALTTLYKFCSLTKCADGDLPFGPLIQATDGNFYGTTEGGGGPSGDGVVFKITPTGTLTTIYDFCSETNCADGQSTNGLIQAADGNFYGVNSLGGAHGVGTVFKLTPSGALTTLYTFCSLTSCADGSEPVGTLVQATDGDFYGTTEGGGTSTSCRCGTIFKITSSGSLTTLHSFDGSDGEFPSTSLLQATDGNFYGGTSQGGANNDGSIFSLSVGLGPLVALVQNSGKVGQTGGILGQGFTGTTDVSIDGTPATFTVVSDTYLRVTVPASATSGFVTVSTPTGVLTSNVPFTVRQ
jgi:uncharacterized repeat protein (TIGR03803 family)